MNIDMLELEKIYDLRLKIQRYEEIFSKLRKLCGPFAVSCEECSFYANNICEADGDCPYNNVDFINKVVDIVRNGGIMLGLNSKDKVLYQNETKRAPKWEDTPLDDIFKGKEEAAKLKALINDVIMYCEEQNLKYDTTACDILNILLPDEFLTQEEKMYKLIGIKKIKINKKESPVGELLNYEEKYPEFTEKKKFAIMQLLSHVENAEDEGLLISTGDRVHLKWHPWVTVYNKEHIHGEIEVEDVNLEEALASLIIELWSGGIISEEDKNKIKEILESEN